MIDRGTPTRSTARRGSADYNLVTVDLFPYAVGTNDLSTRPQPAQNTKNEHSNIMKVFTQIIYPPTLSERSSVLESSSIPLQILIMYININHNVLHY